MLNNFCVVKMCLKPSGLSTGCFEEELEECLVDLCQNATCDVPEAVCVADNCLECSARWFLGFEEVTDLCTTR